ncbi:Protein jagged-1b, partial [Stegodyphus mimosarum]
MLVKIKMKVLLWVAACVFVYLLPNMGVVATGSFELEVLGIQNLRGELSNGSCCSVSDNRFDNGTCVEECRTFFRLCLKEYQTEVSDTGPCTFGTVSTPVVGGNTFSMHSNPHQNVVLRLPFTFR